MTDLEPKKDERSPFVEKVMARVGRERPGIVVRAGNVFFGRRSLRYTLATGLPLCAVLALSIVGVVRMTAPAPVPRAASGEPTIITPPGDGAISVRFKLSAPDARTVALAGDFNGWQPSKAELRDEDGDGVWTVTLRLASGRYQYNFVVDGEEWVIDPDADLVVADGFGGRSAVLKL